MSAYTTISITREDAIQEIIKRMINAKAVDLEDILLNLIGRDGLYDFSIVSSYYPPSPYILTYRDTKHLL